MSGLNRREFMAIAAGSMILAGCSRRAARKPPVHRERLVSILRQTTYGQDLYGELRRLLAAHHLNVRGKRVLLKPNLVEFEPDSPIHTHPLLVHAALEAFRALGAEVRIAEGPGHRRNTLDMAEAAGYFETIPRFEEIFTDLNLDRVAEVRLASNPFAAAIDLSGGDGSRLRSAGFTSQDEDASLGGRHAEHEKPVWNGFGRRIWMAQEHPALGRNS